MFGVFCTLFFWPDLTYDKLRIQKSWLSVSDHFGNKQERQGKIIYFINLSPIRLADIMADNLKIRLTNKMPNVFFATCIKIIQTDNIIAFIDQSLTKMRANKTGATGY